MRVGARRDPAARISQHPSKYAGIRWRRRLEVTNLIKRATLRILIGRQRQAIDGRGGPHGQPAATANEGNGIPSMRGEPPEFLTFWCHREFFRSRGIG
jgi:hypothetical protein